MNRALTSLLALALFSTGVAPTPAHAMGKIRRWLGSGSAATPTTDASIAKPSKKGARPAVRFAPTLTPTERRITIIQTNDIHGGVEATVDKSGAKLGGMSFFSGVIRSLEEGLLAKDGRQSGVVLVDGGDQSEGTLISNFNEGQLVTATMNVIGYDAAVTGNHDYDFGPKDWRFDEVTDQTADKDPRGALNRVADQANFPFISANTYLISSLVEVGTGAPVKVRPSGCVPAAGAKIDWAKARHPRWLNAHSADETRRGSIVKTVAEDVRVAIIGIDNSGTPDTTTRADVADLCFGDEADAYLRARAELEGKADVYVLLMHQGDSSNQFDGSKILRKIQAAEVDGRHLVDAVAAGHTHYTNNVALQGVPLIQSGSGGAKFGRIDLIYDVETKTVLTERTQTAAGIMLFHDHCAPAAEKFCATETAPGRQPVVSYEGVPVAENPAIDSLIAEARKAVAPYADRKLCHLEVEIKPNRDSESVIADVLTDALRASTGADIVFMNAGGMRAGIAPGDVTYEDLYRVVPFNNHAVEMKPMLWKNVRALLEHSIKTCGAYGALLQSGLRVKYTRDCTRGAEDAKAALVHVETLAGKVLLDAPTSVAAPDTDEFTVVTLDFLALGGSGYSQFSTTKVTADRDIARELIANALESGTARLFGVVDGRWECVSGKSCRASKD